MCKSINRVAVLFYAAILFVLLYPFKGYGQYTWPFSKSSSFKYGLNSAFGYRKRGSTYEFHRGLDIDEDDNSNTKDEVYATFSGTAYARTATHIAVKFSGLGDGVAEVAGENFSKGVKKLALADELFPEAKLVWGRTFKGRMLDFKIAKESGHVAIATVDDESKQATVYYFDPDGALLWKLNSKANTNLPKVGKVNLSISEDGKILLVSWWWDEFSETQVYNEHGELLFRKRDQRYTAPWVISPKGAYLISGDRKTIYKPDGAPINITYTSSDNWYYYRFYPISDDAVVGLAKEKFSDLELREYSKNWLKERRDELSKSNLEPEEVIQITKRLDHLEWMLSQGYSKPPGIPEPPSRTQLCVVSLPDGTLKKKYEISKGARVAYRSLGSHFYLNVEGDMKGRKKISLLNFSKDGTFLWNIDFDLPLYPTALADRNDKVAIFTGREELYILDNRTGKILTYEQVGQKDTPDPTYCFLWDKDRLILSGERMLSSEGESLPDTWNWTYIWRLDKDFKIMGKLTREGLVIGFSDSKIVGIYQSDSERRYPARKSDNFVINILVRGTK